MIGSRKEALRKYVGMDVQISIDWDPGITTIRGEYIQGDQPGFYLFFCPVECYKKPGQQQLPPISTIVNSMEFTFTFSKIFCKRRFSSS